MKRLLLLSLLLCVGCGHCNHARPHGPDPVLGDYSGPPLPRTAKGLLEEADKMALLGPSGPDLVRSYRSAFELLSREPKNGQAAWRAARALYYLTLTDERRAPKIAKRCLELIKPKNFQPPEARVFHFSALCFGARSLAKKTEALKLLPKMLKLAETAIETKPDVEHAGPHRVLGGIYLKAPAWPLSVGDLDEALVHLERAIKIAPDWAENHLLYAEALIEDEREDEASAALEKAKALMKRPDHAGWLKVLGKDLSRVEERLNEAKS